MGPLVTVIIDTFNYGRFIENAIDSVLNQSINSSEIEIIVVDDGSTDDTRERIKKYKDKIKYLYKDNGGQASAFNAGYVNATGKYIVLLDSDDTCDPKRVESVVEEFEKYDDVVTVLNNRRIINEGLQKIEKFGGFHNIELNDKNLNLIIEAGYGTSRTSLRKNSVDQIFPIPEKGLEVEADLYLNLVCFFLGNISVLPGALTNYRIHGENNFALTTKANISKHIIWMENALNFIRNTVSGFPAYREELLNALLKPYEVEIRSKKLALDSMHGLAKRWDFLQIELDRIRINKSGYNYSYLIYKYVSALFLTILPVKKALKLKDYYSRYKISKIRNIIIPD